MALIYYAKLNINSVVFDIYSGKVKIHEILDKLYTKIDEETEFAKTTSFYIEEESELKEITELYCFSDIVKSLSPRKYISGKVVRRFPLHTEEFDEETRTSRKVVLQNNSVSINFYFDVDNEIISFCTRQKFGQNQFVEAFQGLVNQYMKDIDFEIIILQDSLNIREKLQKVYKITKIKSVFVPPNANEEHLRAMYDNSVKNMEDANVTKKTNIFETSKKSNKGINLQAKMIEDILGTEEAHKKYKNGYAKIEAEGEHEDGSRFHYSSEKDSPYITVIDDEIKNVIPEFILCSQNGINIYIANKMRIQIDV
ncbi:hypothetical protein SDC9_20871 [bioreactor metagenome]|uniref:DUF4747 domain-containing protein n=1 Tax=bioreactor metagenome TaxID=1076179 RepID=A0A644U801_9ZZZZ|nr:hypothetical protein [Negativicutes bacterium]